jgi:hypothetical protein
MSHAVPSALFGDFGHSLGIAFDFITAADLHRAVTIRRSLEFWRYDQTDTDRASATLWLSGACHFGIALQMEVMSQPGEEAMG